MTAGAGLVIREAEPRDRADWIALWDGFVAAKPSEPGERGLGPVNWQRIADTACPMRCIVAAEAGQSCRASCCSR